jgi:transcriptional regulator with XRE-family HTH domain
MKRGAYLTYSHTANEKFVSPSRQQIITIVSVPSSRIVVEKGMCAKGERASSDAAAKLRTLIGARIRSVREARRLSLEELGYGLKIAPSYVAEIERGLRNPSAHTLAKLASGLGVEVGLLFPTIEEIGGEIAVQPKPRAKAGPRQDAAQGNWLTREAERTVQVRHDESEWLNNVQSEMERNGKRTKKEGTLIGTGTAARLLGMDRRTLERRLERNEIQASDYVDNERAVFRRDEIERLAESKRQDEASK